ncbi:MAG: hypothetical protein IPM52_10750 [Bacteroidetes bacterium]|nr:hypothetical protein [Bacteroidota bacterium]
MEVRPAIRSALIALIIFASLVQGSGRLFILINFKLHQAYIARVLCEQREVANNQCQGNCHLKKELRKSEDRERKQQPPVIQLKEVLLCPPPKHGNSMAELVRPIAKKIFPDCNPDILRGACLSVFHPPENQF